MDVGFEYILETFIDVINGRGITYNTCGQLASATRPREVGFSSLHEPKFSRNKPSREA